MQAAPTLTDMVTRILWLIPIGLGAIVVLLVALTLASARSPRRWH